jgi:hypothetical protein
MRKLTAKIDQKKPKQSITKGIIMHKYEIKATVLS